MGELGDQVFTFNSNREAHNFLHKINPPDLLVRSVYLDDADGSRHFTSNPFFWPAAYECAVEEQRWREGYFRRTGKLWNGSDGRKHSSLPGGAEEEVEDLDIEACLRLLGLEPGYTPVELATAYRETIRMNHPDKVASMAEEFRMLAERRNRLINQAYAKLMRRVPKA
jgi:DnaJ-domain-containing protein 1